MLAQTWGPYAGGSYLGATAPGVYTFIGDTPKGPFRPDTGAYRLLGNTHTRSTHFARFYETPNEVLANHFLFTRSLKAWLAPLKKAVLDDEGHLRLDYWPGNEAMKGSRVAVSPSPQALFGRDEITVQPLDGQFDLVRGVVVEGTLKIQTNGKGQERCGLYIEETTEQGTAVMVGIDGKSQLGTLKLGDAISFEPEEFVEAGTTPDCEHTFRLLTRQYMLEFYVDDRLIQCYSIPERSTGRIGLVMQGEPALIGNLKAWEMTFPAAKKQPDQGIK